MKDRIDPIYDFLQERGHLTADYQLEKNPDELQNEQEDLVNRYQQLELIMQNLTQIL